MATDLAGTRTEFADPPRQSPRSLYDVLFSPFTTAFAVVALVLSFVLPPDGLGVPTCWFRWLFGHPCPGCGLTRSLTCISHLQFGKAWDYHPFGPLLYGLFFVNVALLCLPRRQRTNLQTRVAQQDHWLRPVYWATVFAFLIFGVVRLLWSVLSA